MARVGSDTRPGGRYTSEHGTHVASPGCVRPEYVRWVNTRARVCEFGGVDAARDGDYALDMFVIVGWVEGEAAHAHVGEYGSVDGDNDSLVFFWDA